MDTHIQINGLIKTFGEKTAINIPELSINRGELIGLVGNNGAGKTTLFRLILDLLKANQGSVSSNGTDVSKSESWKQYTGSFIDSGFLIEFLTPEEFFFFIGSMYHISKTEVTERLAAFEPFMSHEILGQNKYIRHFSAGNKQKIGIVASMLIEPEVLILDEPFNFLDPTSQIIIKELIKNMNQNRGTTVLLSSHNLNHITGISTRVLLLESGNILQDIDNTQGKAVEMLDNYFIHTI